MFPQHRILLLITQVVLAVNVCSGVDYYVTPTPPPNPDCPASKICNTLDYYAANSSVLFDNKDNISLLFLNGNHNLTREFAVSNISSFDVAGALHSDHIQVIIVDSEASGFWFKDTDFLSIRNLSFTLYQMHQQISSTQCLYLENIQMFKGQNVLASKCSLHVSYDFLSRTDQLNLQQGPPIRHFLVQDCQIVFASVSIESKSSLSYNSSVKATFVRSRIFGGGLEIDLEQTNFLLVIRDSNISQAYTGLDIAHSSIVNSVTFLTVMLENAIITNNSYGIVIMISPSGSRIDNHAYNTDDVVPNSISVQIKRTSLLDNKNNGIYVLTLMSNLLYVQLEQCIIERNGKNGVLVSSVLVDTDFKIIDCLFRDNRKAGVVLDHRSVILRRSSLSLSNTTIVDNKLDGLFVNCVNVTLNVSVVNSTVKNNSRIGVMIQAATNNGDTHMAFIHCTFSYNRQGGMALQSDSNMSVSISQCLFEYNYKMLGKLFERSSFHASVITASTLMIECSTSEESKVTIRNTAFRYNKDDGIKSKTVFMSQCQSIHLVGPNNFENNVGTPIEVTHGDLFVSGILTFRNNLAFRGGGLSLVYVSTMYLHSDAQITFINNSVIDTGGGIYVSAVSGGPNTFCFYRLVDSTKNDLKIVFSNNSAANGGEDIFGAAINDTCFVSETPGPISSASVYKNVFNFSNTFSLSRISSEPTRVCLCNSHGVPQCTDERYILSSLGQPLYPGESLTLSVVIVGKEFGTASGTVYAELTDFEQLQFIPSIKTNQHAQAVTFDQCNLLEYTIYSHAPTNIELVLTATFAHIKAMITKKYVDDLISVYKKSHVTPDLILDLPVYTNITIEDCPLGFSLSKDPPYKCDCDERLTSNGVDNCLIQNHTGYIYRSNTIWIGSSNDSNDIIIHLYCPYGYCRTDNVSVDPAEPDSQCAVNRTGILCGECKDDLSLALGSYRCIHCPNNNYVALLIPIILGTVLLVALIKLLDLTVAKGTLNGLIFYANIMWSNKSLFISTDESSGAPYYITHTFLAWLNLDFGIETCFIKHLNAIGITWFHFGQDALYIIVITLMIYVSSRYSTLATRVLGNNSVPVLATMFFLSYTKLFHTVINTLGFSVLNYPNTTDIVWSLDGNVLYFSLGHSFLFVVALFALFLLWLPYTIILTFGQCLRRKSHLYLLKWMDKQTPYFDAYYGPLKDKYHYWFGGLLIARGILLIIYAITSTIFPQFNLLAIVVVSACLLLHPYQYKQWIHSLLEKLFFLNLVFVASGVLLIELVGGDKRPIVYTSVGIALVHSFGIVTVHVKNAIQSFRQSLKRKTYCFENHTQASRNGYEDIDRRPYSSFEESSKLGKWERNENACLREPLLESTS